MEALKAIKIIGNQNDGRTVFLFTYLLRYFVYLLARFTAANPLIGYTLLPQQQNQFWKFCLAQSRSELLLTPDWPMGGISGTLSRKVPSELLNADREVAFLSTTFEGKQFHSLGALTAKECS